MSALGIASLVIAFAWSGQFALSLAASRRLAGHEPPEISSWSDAPNRNEATDWISYPLAVEWERFWRNAAGLLDREAPEHVVVLHHVGFIAASFAFRRKPFGNPLLSQSAGAVWLQRTGNEIEVRTLRCGNWGPVRWLRADRYNEILDSIGELAAGCDATRPGQQPR